MTKIWWEKNQSFECVVNKGSTCQTKIIEILRKVISSHASPCLTLFCTFYEHFIDSMWEGSFEKENNNKPNVRSAHPEILGTITEKESKNLMKLKVLVPYISIYFMEKLLKNFLQAVDAYYILQIWSFFVLQVDYLKKFGYLSEASPDSANNLILDEAAALETAIKSLQVRLLYSFIPNFH